MVQFLFLQPISMDDLPVYAYPRDTVGSVPDHHNKASHNPFAGGGSCFPFAKEKKKRMQHL